MQETDARRAMDMRVTLDTLWYLHIGAVMCSVGLWIALWLMLRVLDKHEQHGGCP
jgi:hypothetical protein